MTRRCLLLLCVLSCGGQGTGGPDGAPDVDAALPADGPAGTGGTGGVGGAGGVGGSGGSGGSGGMTGRPVGDGCTSASDCADGLCLSLPGGYCSRVNCDAAGCPAGSQCFYLAGSSTYACLKSCAASSDCRTAEGYICDSTQTCYPGGSGGTGGTGGSGGMTGQCSDPWGRDCPTGHACDLTTHLCVTTCSQDRPCNGGCCSAGSCVAGTDVNACGSSGWHCYNCATGCTQGAACGGTTCQCTSGCIPSGQACSVGTNGCCSGFCGGLNGNTRCQ